MRASPLYYGPRRRPIQKLRIMPSPRSCQIWASGSRPSRKIRGRRCAGGGLPSAARRRTNLNEGRSCGGGAARRLVCFHARRWRTDGTHSTPSTRSRRRRSVECGTPVRRRRFSYAGPPADAATSGLLWTRPAPRRASIKPGARVSTASPSSSSTRSWTAPAPPRSQRWRKRNARRRRVSLFATSRASSTRRRRASDSVMHFLSTWSAALVSCTWWTRRGTTLVRTTTSSPGSCKATPKL